MLFAGGLVYVTLLAILKHFSHSFYFNSDRYRVMMMKMRNKLVWAARPVPMVKAMMKTTRVPIVNEKKQFARKDSFLYYNLRINIHEIC